MCGSIAIETIYMIMRIMEIKIRSSVNRQAVGAFTDVQWLVLHDRC